MKKIQILFFSIILSVLVLQENAFAKCNYQELCPNAPNQNYLRAPFIFEQFASNIIKTEIKKNTGQDFDVKLESTTFADLVSGKFKTLTFEGKNIQFEGIFLSSLKIKTLCDYVNIDIQSKPLKIRENTVLGVWIEANAQDLKNTASNPKYLDAIQAIDLKSIGIESFTLYPETIGVADNKIFLTINARPQQPYKPLDIAISGDILIKDENILKSRIEFINLYSKFDLTQFANFLSSVHNLNFKFNLFDRSCGAQIKDISISQDKVLIYGEIFIPRD